MASHDRANVQHIRYLFDSQLFNVPNNYHHFEYLLAYLKHERIFDMSYVVRQQSTRLRRTEFAGLAHDADLPRTGRSGLGVGDAGAAERWTNWSSLSRNAKSMNANVGAPGGQDDAERCRMLFTNACSGVAGTPSPRQTRLAAQPHQLSHPINRIDVRDLMTNLTLHGGAREWLDLKLTLCLPAYVIFIKLNTSNTRIPNPDYTLNVSLKDLRVFSGNQTIGESLSMAIAEMRHTFFEIPLPDFDRLTLLKDGGLVEANEAAPPIQPTNCYANAATASGMNAANVANHAISENTVNSVNARNATNSSTCAAVNLYGQAANTNAVPAGQGNANYNMTTAPFGHGPASSWWQEANSDGEKFTVANEPVDFEEELDRFNATGADQQREQETLERQKREKRRLQIPGALRKVLVVSEFSE